VSSGETQRDREVEPWSTRRLGVIPFSNLGGSSQDDYFADGMTDELTTVLSRIPQLKVIARTSMLRYKGTRRRISQIGRELNVDSLVEGTVAKSQDRVRISVQLVDARTEEHLWAKRYELKQGDIFRIQGEIATQVARELKLTLQRNAAELAPLPTRDLEAHTLYLRARYHWKKRSEDGIKTAIGYLEEAIKKDPDYSLALVGLADCYHISALFGYTSPRDVYPRARDLALRAIKDGGASAEAHSSLGEFLMHYSYDWAGAARELERALQVNPNYAVAHLWRSTCHAVLGQFDDALVEARRGEELDPFAVVAMNEVAKNYYYARKYDDAIGQFERSLRIEPGSAYLRKGLAETYAQESMYREAAREIERALSISRRGALFLDAAAGIFALSNDDRRLREVLAEADRLAKAHFVPSYGRAAAYAALGDKEKALQFLHTAYDEHSWLIWVGVDPLFDSLRREKEFRSLLRKMKLEPESASSMTPAAPLHQAPEQFEFESERSKIIFEQLASDFLRDYMSLNFMEERSGWRSIVEIAHETRIPVSSLYAKAPKSTPAFRELWRRGLVEMKLSPGERGRGGEVTKIRVAYNKSPVRSYVDNFARVVKKSEPKSGSVG
jgi:TolB-like protein/Tfp pilus assembly protein PilF